MTEDEEPTGSLILGQFSVNYDDLPIKELTERPIDNGVYRSRFSPHIFVYHAESDHWNRFVEKFL